MAQILEKIKVAKDKSDVFKKMEKGKRYQIIFDTGESVTIAVLAQGKIETTGDDLGDEAFAKASQYSVSKNEDELTAKQMIAILSKDKELREEPLGLYSRDYGKDTL